MKRGIMIGGFTLAAVAIAIVATWNIAVAQQLPVTQTASSGVDSQGRWYQRSAIWTMPSGSPGTYKYQFIEKIETDLTWYVIFHDMDYNFNIESPPFTSTSPACAGAYTVELQPNRKYEMFVAYPLENPSPLDEQIWVQAKIFYECTQE